MSPQTPLGQLIQSFFLDHLIAVKGLRPASVRSYRDTIRLLIVHVAKEKRSKITKLIVGDLTFDRIVGFHLAGEEDVHPTMQVLGACFASRQLGKDASASPEEPRRRSDAAS